jgi:TRAP-type C4-dicarboxylate transport system substrate-binding protein
MSRSRHSRTRALLGALVLAAAFLARSAGADTVTLKFGSAMPPFAPVAGEVVIPWLKQIESASGGTVKFEQFWGSQLVQNPTMEYQALENGVVDVDMLVPAFFQQVMPDSAIFALPGVVRSAEEAAYGGWKMYEAGLLRGMDKLYVAGTFSNDPGGIHFAKKVTSLDAMKGLKIRVSGPAEAQIVRALGAAPVGMGVTDIAESLSRGVYDGTLNGWSANHLYRVTPVLKSHFDLSLGVRQMVLVMNRKVYDGLPAKARAAIDQASGLDLSLRLAHAMEEDGDRERADARAKGTIVALSAADETRLAAAEAPLIDAYVKDTPDGRKKYDFLQHALEEFRAARPAN